MCVCVCVCVWIWLIYYVILLKRLQVCTVLLAVKRNPFRGRLYAVLNRTVPACGVMWPPDTGAQTSSLQLHGSAPHRLQPRPASFSYWASGTSTLAWTGSVRGFQPARLVVCIWQADRTRPTAHQATAHP